MGGGWPRARPTVLVGGDRATHACRLPGTALVTVSGVVVSHGHPDAVARLVPLLLPQLDELVVIANVPGSVRDVPRSVRVLQNERPGPLAANVNKGIAATAGEFVLFSNPDVVPAADAVAQLHAFMVERERTGIAGPEMRWPDGRWQPSRRRFPTVGGT